MIVGATQIGYVVIDAATSRALLLLGAGEALHVTIVVIGPDDGDVVGQFQPLVVHIQYLFIGSESLRNGFGSLARSLGHHLSLCLQSCLHGVLAFRHIVTARHGHIVQSA